MPKYHCYGVVTGSKYLGLVVADNEEEAKEDARGLGTAYVSFCHQCAGHCEDPEITEFVVEEEKE
jgi:hypothetical protein